MGIALQPDILLVTSMPIGSTPYKVSDNDLTNHWVLRQYLLAQRRAQARD